MTQLEKNKEILMCEIEKYSSCPMTDSVAEHLSVYYAALKSLFEMEEHMKEAAYSAQKPETAARNAMYAMPGKRETHHPAHKLTEQDAETWMGGLENADGTSGAHWTRTQTDQVLAKYGLKYDELLFWVVMNSIYSDDVNVAKRHNVNTLDYYVDRAKAWLDDEDANPDKALLYYQTIVKH